MPGATWRLRRLSVAFSFLVALREGVEMALIVAILLSYLRSIGQKQHFKEIWAGVVVAGAICLAVGVTLELASAEMDKKTLEAFEGFTMIIAVVLLTGMSFWMQKTARGMSAGLRSHVDSALSGGSVAALVLLAASSVGREGLETTLFLFAGSSTASSGFDFILGGLLGFVIAAGVGLVIYHGARWFPIRRFLQVSSVLVLIMAAGLLSNSISALYGAGILTNIGDRPWDTDNIISITSDLGKFLKTLAGYDSAPSMLQLVLYWGYLVLALGAYLLIPFLSNRKSSQRVARGTAGRTA